jgi:hypothetical protein
MKLRLVSVGVTILSGCSDDEEKTTKSITKKVTSTAKKVTAVPNKVRDAQYYKDMSQPMDKATWTEKGKFRNEFADDCVAREKATAKEASSIFDRDHVVKTCECIADYMDDHLTDDEAEEYLRDDNHNRSLQIRFDAAAYNCLQAS